ncbi:hypothetical protein GCM10008906_11360 [Clostridium oceanicum]|uniref:ABC-2 family transporter protein n=2 Tax=Clostridium oceanicum TaxID=1543 RepID=A0ABP3ULI8_9CLOT
MLLWIAVVSLITALTMFFKNTKKFIFFYISLFLIIKQVIMNLISTVISTESIEKITILRLFDQISLLSESIDTLIFVSLVSVGYIAIFIAIGLIYFHKREVK